jgi:DNA uptake protein ComE-like DNA-binding protein
MLTNAVAILCALAFFLLSVVNIVIDKRQDKRFKASKELVHAQIETQKKMIDSLNNMTVDVEQFESLKRWLSITLDELQSHSDKMETFNQTRITINNASEEDIEKMVKEIRKAPLTVINKDR